MERSKVRVLVWDWPVRVFHALLILAFTAAWLTSGDDRWTYAHVFTGYVALALIVFRVVWGFTGTRHALFSSFAASPRAALAYFRDLLAGRAQRFVTHNPVGSWAVWLLMALAVALAISGLLTLGGEEQQGPLAGLLSRPDGIFLRDVHEFVAWAGVALIAVHVIGVLAESRVHHENLVRAMFDGRKDGEPADAIPSARGVVAIALLVSLAVFAIWYFRGYLTATPKNPYLPYTSPALPTNSLWSDECGSCHIAYHPSLLPVRSWNAMLDQQNDHFGEDLALDAQTISQLRTFAAMHAADQSALPAESEAALKIALTTPLSLTPLRITETPYWKDKHADIPDTAWKTKPVHGKGDCGACHADAEKATFEDGAMRVP